MLNKILTDMVTCAATELSPTPSRVIISPGGPVAWDDCCAGQVWSRVISQVPGDTSAKRSGMCVPAIWVVTIGLGVVRCAAVVDDLGRAPTPAEVSADSTQMVQDAEALKQSLTCCMDSDLSLRFMSWNPLGPQGGCVGGEWKVAVRLGNCGCP